MHQFFLKTFVILVVFFNSINGQIHLNKTNLAFLCRCDPFKSFGISLHNKNIKTIDPATFNGLTSLRKLYLSSNKITSLHPSVFKDLSSLQQLHLDSNQISEIDPSSFKHLNSLQMLFLSNNKIGTNNSLKAILNSFSTNNKTIINLNEMFFKNHRDVIFIFESDKVISFSRKVSFNSSNLSKVCLYPMLDKKFITKIHQLSFNLTGDCVKNYCFHEHILKFYGFESNLKVGTLNMNFTIVTNSTKQTSLQTDRLKSFEMTSKLRGTVTFDGDSHIASNSTAYISINDVSRACAPSIKIAETTISNPSSFPISFEISYDNTQFCQGISGRFSLSVRIENAGDLTYVTDTNWSVVDSSNTRLVESMDVPVIKIVSNPTLLVSPKLSGTVTFDGDKNIAPNSIAYFKIIDISRLDAPAKIIAETSVLYPTSFPISFEIYYDEALFSNGMQGPLSLSVRIEEAGNLTYTTDTNWSVLDSTNTRIVESINVPVIKTMAGPPPL